MILKSHPCMAVALAACALPAVGLARDGTPTSGSDSVVVDATGTEAAGVRQFNIAAGYRNQQANVASLVVGDIAVASASVAQAHDNPPLGAPRAASAAIAAGAFASSHGLTSVNVTAGSDNQQVNMALIAIGLEGRVATDAALLQTRASHEPKGDHPASAAPERTVTMGPGAFENSSGIIQVSLIGGERNSSANLAVLSVEAGTQ